MYFVLEVERLQSGSREPVLYTNYDNILTIEIIRILINDQSTVLVCVKIIL